MILLEGGGVRERSDRREFLFPEYIRCASDVVEWYIDNIGMAEYTGSNWDAFEESLGEIAFSSKCNISILHREAINLSTSDLSTYIGIIRSLPEDAKKIEFVFSRELLSKISDT